MNENADLRSQNRSLMEENTRLSDLTRMLLGSPSFSGFLDSLSANTAAAQQQQTPIQQTPIAQTPQPETRQVRKDVNPYPNQQQVQPQQHVGMTMIPEQSIDFSMLDLNFDVGFSYQPQVFSVFSVPDTVIDVEILSGKPNSSLFASNVEKVEIPVVDRMPASVELETPLDAATVNGEEFDADPTFALYAQSQNTTSISLPLELLELEAVQIFGGIQPEKAGTCIELVVEASSSPAADRAMVKILKLCESLDAAAARLEVLTLDL